MTARDIRYGRRGGRWANPGNSLHAQALAGALAASRAGRRPVDLAVGVLFHPEAIARQRAHQRGCTHGPDTRCPAVPDPGDLAELWAGRARMATARLTAGQPLDRLDRHALDLHAPKGAAAS
jgi:hypothetical protein